MNHPLLTNEQPDWVWPFLEAIDWRAVDGEPAVVVPDDDVPWVDPDYVNYIVTPLSQWLPLIPESKL